MFQKTKEIKTCCGKSTFVRWRRHHSLQHVCRVVCLCRLQMWFAVEKQDVFSFSQPSPAGMCRQRCGWAGMYACPHVHFTVLSAGCAVIHNVTVNTYCEKEKELPRVLFQRLVAGTFLEDNTLVLIHTHARTHSYTMAMQRFCSTHSLCLLVNWHLISTSVWESN